MLHSNDNGQSIRSRSGNRNLRAYHQTRYESIVLCANIRLKFVTDGILLSEISSDFLLRKYKIPFVRISVMQIMPALERANLINNVIL